MIIPSIIERENTYYKIFQAVEIAFNKLNSNNKKTKGRHVSIQTNKWLPVCYMELKIVSLV